MIKTVCGRSMDVDDLVLELRSRSYVGAEALFSTFLCVRLLLMR